MLLSPKVKKGRITMSKFLDFDNQQAIFYDNIYLEDCKFVVKMPLVRKWEQKDIKIEKFDLTKYTYLLAYE